MIKYNSNTINDWNFGSSNVTKVYRNGTVRYVKLVPNYEIMPFTTVARTDGTINFTIGSGLTVPNYRYIKYSTDNGNTWTKVDNVNGEQVDFSVSVNAGDRVQWKGKGTRMASLINNNNTAKFLDGTAQFDIEGNIMSLLNEDEYVGAQIISSNTFFALFNGCDGLINARNLILPNNVFTSSYRAMFNDCSNLLTAPKLPATRMATTCYQYMFKGCTRLTTAPSVLPATTLGQKCYYSMFRGCTSLTSAPQLPATTLASQCYREMFYGCASLTTAPELPATTLASTCYYGMFRLCTSLTTAPKLLATTLESSCYQQMFYGCSSLNSIKCLATDISASNCTTDWVRGVAASGTFIKDPSMEDWTTGDDGIPSGWTVEDAQ